MVLDFPGIQSGVSSFAAEILWTESYARRVQLLVLVLVAEAAYLRLLAACLRPGKALCALALPPLIGLALTVPLVFDPRVELLTRAVATFECERGGKAHVFCTFACAAMTPDPPCARPPRPAVQWLGMWKVGGSAVTSMGAALHAARCRQTGCQARQRPRPRGGRLELHPLPAPAPGIRRHLGCALAAAPWWATGASPSSCSCISRPSTPAQVRARTPSATVCWRWAGSTTCLRRLVISGVPCLRVRQARARQDRALSMRMPQALLQAASTQLPASPHAPAERASGSKTGRMQDKAHALEMLSNFLMYTGGAARRGGGGGCHPRPWPVHSKPFPADHAAAPDTGTAPAAVGRLQQLEPPCCNNVRHPAPCLPCSDDGGGRLQPGRPGHAEGRHPLRLL